MVTCVQHPRRIHLLTHVSRDLRHTFSQSYKVWNHRTSPYDCTAQVGEWTEPARLIEFTWSVSRDLHLPTTPGERLGDRLESYGVDKSA